MFWKKKETPLMKQIANGLRIETPEKHDPLQPAGSTPPPPPQRETMIVEEEVVLVRPAKRKQDIRNILDREFEDEGFLEKEDIAPQPKPEYRKPEPGGSFSERLNNLEVLLNRIDEKIDAMESLPTAMPDHSATGRETNELAAKLEGIEQTLEYIPRIQYRLQFIEEKLELMDRMTNLLGIIHDKLPDDWEEILDRSKKKKGKSSAKPDTAQIDMFAEDEPMELTEEFKEDE